MALEKHGTGTVCYGHQGAYCHELGRPGIAWDEYSPAWNSALELFYNLACMLLRFFALRPCRL